jgi:predicted component of type VI protein secretion system
MGTVEREAHVIAWLIRQVEERADNANWCEAEAVAVQDPQHRQMLLTIAGWDREKAQAFLADARSRMLRLAVEYGVDIRPFTEDEEPGT